MSATRPLPSRNARYASVVTQNARGTGNPARTNSPRFAPLPPTRGRSLEPISSSVHVNACIDRQFLVAVIAIGLPSRHTAGAGCGVRVRVVLLPLRPRADRLEALRLEVVDVR